MAPIQEDGSEVERLMCQACEQTDEDLLGSDDEDLKDDEFLPRERTREGFLEHLRYCKEALRWALTNGEDALTRDEEDMVDALVAGA